jgi:hypothetical protein
MSRNVFILGSFLLAWSNLSQSQPTYRYAYVSFLDGELSVQRAAEPEPEMGSVNMPILPGDRVWTHRDSRAEVRLNGGSRLRLDESTKLDFVDLESETIVRLWNGAAILKLSENEGAIRIDSPAGSIRPTMPGTYRIDVEEGSRVTLSVARGSAELASTDGAVVVGSGETSRVTSGEAPDIARPFNTASLDEFDLWSDRRDQSASTVRNLGSRSVPDEVQGYVSELNDYGDWAIHSTYGSVWYPSVSPGFVPYRNGRWCYTPFGYTWASFEPWGWAPYHYGRWGYNPRGWYWIPGSVWNPAWVSFVVGPYWVGWSALGHGNLPVFGFDSHFRRHGIRRHAKPRHDWGHPSGNSSGWSFATRDHFRGGSGGMWLDDDLIRESAPRARRLAAGDVLDRDLNPRGAGRVPWVERQGGLRLSERAPRASAETGRTVTRTGTASMPRVFTAPRENPRAAAADVPRSTAGRFGESSRTIPSSPWIRPRSNDSGDPGGWRASNGRSSAFRESSGRVFRPSADPPRATVVPPRADAPRESVPRSASSRSVGRARSSAGREWGQRQSFERSSRPSSPSGRVGGANSRGGAPRGWDRGGGASARASGGGRARSNRN